MGTIQTLIVSLLSVAAVSLTSFTIPANAVILQPIEAPDNLRPGDPSDEPVPECDQIQDRLAAYREAMVKHNDGVTGFVGQISAKVSSWFDELSPLEGSKDAIPVGTFNRLSEGVEAINEVNGWLYDVNDLSTTELDKILEAMQNCRITKASE